MKKHDSSGHGPGRRIVRSGPAPYALEERLMFDGAAPADVLGVAAQLLEAAPVGGAADNPVPAAVATPPASVTPLLSVGDPGHPLAPMTVAAGAQVRTLLADFLARPGAEAALAAIFNPPDASAQSFDERVQALRQVRSEEHTSEL